MATSLDSLFDGQRKRRGSPTQTLGRPGTAVFGGYVVENEKSADLTDRERYRTFSDILANCSIVAAGTRYFLNLCAKASWTFKPSEADTTGEFAERAEQILTKDPKTSWPRIVRRAAMYRFYGFSIQEWIARRRDDGVMTFADVAPRAQITIERWDVDVDGNVLGVLQRDPQSQREFYIPRQKVIYMVDDTLNDSPQGLGLFRHVVEPAKRLQRYEQLEGFGYETDLRGIPIGTAPYAQLRQQVKDQEITEEEAVNAVKAIEDFLEKHVKQPDLGLLLDSAVYESLDAESTPSSQPLFGMKLLEGSSTALPDMAKAIERINREIARILAVESILLGDGDRGSNALSKDKTNQFSLTVDSTLIEIADTFATDLLERIWQLNGWPEEMMPEMEPEPVQYRDVEQIAVALRDMAAAGAVLPPNDPVVNDMRSLLGVSLQDEQSMEMAASMRPEQPGAREVEGTPNDPETEMPDQPGDQE